MKCELCFKSMSQPPPIYTTGSVTELRTGGRCFDPRLVQYSFRGLSQFLHHDDNNDDDNDDAKAIAIPQVFSKNSPVKNGKKGFYVNGESISLSLSLLLAKRQIYQFRGEKETALSFY